MTLKEKIMKLQTYKMFTSEDTVYVERDDVLKLLEQGSCEDCVSREDVIMCMTGEYVADITYKPEDIISKHIQRLKALPPVTPIRPKGHWINIDTNMYACNKCSHVLTIDPLDNSILGMKFCPFCSAKMEGVEE